MIQKNCLQCGETFIAQRKLGLYCSPACKARYRYNKFNKRKIQTKKCKLCGNEFKTNLSFMKFCSSQCREHWHENYYRKEYIEKNENIIKQRRLLAYKANRENIIDKVKIYYKKNRAAIIQQKSEYKKANREMYNKTSRRRYAESPKVKLESSIRSLIIRSIKDKRRRSWESIVGYNIYELMAHIEKQFKVGMSWQNYGEWQIDHILPRSYFKYSSCEDEQFKRCWALSNLQPLWRADNIRKRDKIYDQAAI
jgi:endogenous inhibitor of DNA gyrase (YacG/DUF329 family)